jgi:hypothetical protein
LPGFTSSTRPVHPASRWTVRGRTSRDAAIGTDVRTDTTAATTSSTSVTPSAATPG